MPRYRLSRRALLNILKSLAPAAALAATGATILPSIVSSQSVLVPKDILPYPRTGLQLATRYAAAG